MFEPWHIPLLFLTGLAAGFVDAIAGGGGLIALPVLLSFGMDPKQALGTSKLQATFGSGSSAWHYTRAGLVNWRDCRRGIAFTFTGAVIGTLAVQKTDPHFLQMAMPLLLFAIAVYTLIRPQLGEMDSHARMSRGGFDLTFGLLLGFYDGFFGPGVGTFWTMAFVLALGFNLARATAGTKVMNFSSNVASLIFFAQAGKVNYPVGIAMGLGQLVGSQIGSRLVVQRGTKFIRPIFVTVVLVITAKLLYDAFSKNKV